MTWRRFAAVALLTVFLPAISMCGCPPHEPNGPVSTRYTYSVVNTYPHDPTAFTQGLLYHEGVFYESTGLRGQSSLRRVAIETGEVEQIHRLDTQYFAEGLTLLGDRLIQLTWTSGTGFVYDLADFAAQDTFTYPGEGWGLTHNGTRLIMSDGTAELRFLDPETFEELGRVTVRRDGIPVLRLNELEYVEGEVFANVWQTDDIMRIDPETGEVLAVIDCSGLLEQAGAKGPDVLNGIAYDPESGRLWVTGKRWPYVFEITLVPVEDIGSEQAARG